RASGGYGCEKMRLAFVPPKPNELVIACRISRRWGVFGTRLSPLSSAWWSRLVVGGAIWSRNARIVSPASSAPAPPRRWPVIDLVELTASRGACSLDTLAIALASPLSPRGLDVACALRYCTSPGV